MVVDRGALDGAATDVTKIPEAQPFLDPTFHPREYARNQLRNQVASTEHAKALTASMLGLEQQLQAAVKSEVITQQDTLLGCVRRFRTLKTSLESIRGALAVADGGISKQKALIVEPHDSAQSLGTQLKNLNSAVTVLRLVNLRLKQVGKLRQVSGIGEGGPEAAGVDPIELAKAAKIIADIDASAPPQLLEGISVVARDTQFVADSRRAVVDAARALLDRGLQGLSAADVGNALQVFFLLGSLRDVVHEVLQRAAVKVAARLRAALDGGAEGGAGAEAVWNAVDEVLSMLQTGAGQVWHLQRVVAKKSDPLTLTAFVDVVQEGTGATIMDSFWTCTEAAVLEVTGAPIAAKGRSAAAETLSRGFPRLAAMLQQALERISRGCRGGGKTGGAEGAGQAIRSCTTFIRAFAPLQELYVSSSHARMQDAVGALYPAGARALPTSTAVQQCISLLHDEMKAGGRSSVLAVPIAVSVSKALGLLCHRSGMLGASGPELRSLTGPATPVQLRNIALCSQLNEVHRAFVGLLAKLPAQAAKSLFDALELVQSHAVEYVLSIFNAAVSETERIIMGMHASFWEQQAQEQVLATSAYVQELSVFLQHFRADYLAHFSPAPVPNSSSFAWLLCQRLAARALTFFVRHAALLKPLDHSGKLQLAKDASEVEHVVAQHLFPADLLREQHALLRSFRALLFEDTANLLSSSLLVDVPVALVLLHLFSRLPKDVKTPHQYTEVSVQQYSQWMDQHGELDVVKSVSTALSGAKLAGEHEDVLQVMNGLVASANRVC